MASETLLNGNGAKLLDDEVKARVPSSYVRAIDADVEQRQKAFPRASRADVLRDALAEYFRNHPLKKNGKAVARAA